MTFLDEENVVELLFFFQIKRNTQGLCPHAAVSHELVVGELVFLSSNRFIFLPDFRGRSQSLSLTVHLSKRKKKRNIRPTERNARKFLSPPALDFLQPCDFYTAMARAANLDLDARPEEESIAGSRATRPVVSPPWRLVSTHKGRSPRSRQSLRSTLLRGGTDAARVNDDDDDDDGLGMPQQ